MFLLCILMWVGGIDLEMGATVDWQGNLAKITSRAITPKGRIFFANPYEGKIYQTDIEGRALATIGSKGEGPEEFNWPREIFYDAPYLYVYDGAQEKLFRIDEDTGAFLKAWSLSNVGVFGLRNDQFLASFRIPRASHIYGIGSLGKSDISFGVLMGDTPCCLEVSGSKHSALLFDRDGSIWMAYSGEFKLYHYSTDGQLLRLIQDDLPDYVLPTRSKRTSRFDTKSVSANVISFDKINGLYELGDNIVLYRFKRLNDSYLDIFDKQGQRIGLKKSDRMLPVGVKDRVLYAFLRGEETDTWDIRLIKMTLSL